MHNRTLRDLSLFSLLIILAPIAGCRTCIPYDLPTFQFFRDNRIVLEIPPDPIDTTGPMTFTTTVEPLHSGTGTLKLAVRRWPPIMEPKFMIEEVYDTTMTVSFTAGMPVTTRWRVRLPDIDTFQVIAKAAYDSIYIADSARNYWKDSPAAEQYMSGIMGVRRFAMPVFIGNIKYLSPPVGQPRH